MSYGGTDDPTEVAEAILNLIEANSVALGIDGADLYYGDQELIPRYPSVCVESGPITSELAGAPMVLLNTFTNYIMVYHGQIGNQQVTKKDCEKFAYNIRQILHSDKQLQLTSDEGIVIYSYVTRVEPGYAARANQLLRTSRITWMGQSKVIS